jgi:AraC-like DNA-binding protein
MKITPELIEVIDVAACPWESKRGHVAKAGELRVAGRVSFPKEAHVSEDRIKTQACQLIRAELYGGIIGKAGKAHYELKRLAHRLNLSPSEIPEAITELFNEIDNL